jgi:hypothetical protein
MPRTGLGCLKGGGGGGGVGRHRRLNPGRELAWLYGAAEGMEVDHSHTHSDTLSQELFALLDLRALAVALPGSSSEKLQQLQATLFCQLQEDTLQKLWVAAPALEEARRGPPGARPAIAEECDKLLERLIQVLLPLGDPDTASAYVAGGDIDSTGESLLASMASAEVAVEPAVRESQADAEHAGWHLLGDMGLLDFFDSEDDKAPLAATAVAQPAGAAAAPAPLPAQSRAEALEYPLSLATDGRHVLCILLYPDMFRP